VDFNAGSIILRRHTDTEARIPAPRRKRRADRPALGATLAVATGSLIGAHALSGTGRAGATWRAMLAGARDAHQRGHDAGLPAATAGSRSAGGTLWEGTAFLRRDARSSASASAW
jgi:hypothetical protein